MLILVNILKKNFNIDREYSLHSLDLIMSISSDLLSGSGNEERELVLWNCFLKERVVWTGLEPAEAPRTEEESIRLLKSPGRRG